MRLRNQSDIKFFENRFSKINSKLQKSIRNASLGVKVQNAADNAAGIAISETTRAQIRGLGQTQRNIQDGLGLLKTVEDGLMSVNEDVQRIYELAVHSASDTNSPQTREHLHTELQQLILGIQKTSESVEFNTKNLIGAANTPNKPAQILIQIGISAEKNMNIRLPDVSTDNLGLTNVSLLTKEDSEQLMTLSQTIIKDISFELTKIGSQYAALEHNLENTIVLQNNLTSLESNIRDSEMGKELIDMVKEKLLINLNFDLHKYSSDQKENFKNVLFG